ncbi:GNAT family N-acetyltransferase [Leuconostoc litchii]|uniref:N-acetyltransferase family protein n=1 Tax=Leuconostoc litchii TaxID=1981069 RepID=A0A6P2CM41_9LACO|nr:GNAT family N-acetyltransferase [Leuconostoc litchii]TYC47050.1 N-acetyltransferase family protein [Leuconostoc litchii]GMA68983.1 GNAT family N-acetyltransferase [Leuconostoc litchii]
MNIRTATLQDAEQLLTIYAYYIQNSTATFECEIPSLDTFKKRIQLILKTHPYIVVEENGSIIGYAYAHPLNERTAFQWSAEISIYLSSEITGKGIGNALYSRLESILKQQNIVNIMASITEENTTSITFHERRGFSQVGLFKNVGFKFGRWLNNCWMQKTIGDDSKPNSFILFSNLSES